MRDGIRVYFQNHGCLGCDIRWFLLGKTFASATNRQPESIWYRCPVNTVVIEHPEGRFLWDTGAPPDWETRWQVNGAAEDAPYEFVTEEQLLLPSLRRLGLEPGDFSHLLLSHLHFDHVGNLGLFEGTGTTIVAQAAEVAGARAIEGAWAGFYIKDDYTNGFRIEPVDGDTEIADGVTLVSLPGHSWGTQGLMVELANTGTFLYTSDAVLMRESYGPPEVPDPCPWSNLEWLRSVEKVRRLAEKHNATIVFGHDSEQVDNELRLAPDFYD